MKGRRLILIACVIMLSFAGVGYSAWTEGLDIKSFFSTGNIQVVFENPEVVSNGLDVIKADAREGVLTIDGTVSPGSIVVVKYDIYNGSSIPVKYNPDDDDLPERITLDQNDTVIQPGEYLRGNQLTIEPGENELILPFVQYNAKESGGWKEELTIRWNIRVVEEMVIPELVITSDDAITIEAPIEDVPTAEEPEETIKNDPPAVEPDKPIEDVPPAVEPVEPIEEVPQTVEPVEPIGEVSPAVEQVTETTQGVDPTPDTNPIDPDPANNPTSETP